MKRALLLAGLALSSCKDLSVPPPPGPGTIQGFVLFAEPGRLTTVAAAGARITVLGTGASALSDVDGRFTLAGVTGNSGALHFSHTDGSGISRQRVLRLEGIGARPGRDLVLGNVLLSQNATVIGRVTLADVTGQGGHGGISVFVPGAPWSTYTADDGSFRLEALPAGEFPVAFFSPGYGVQSADVVLEGGGQQTLPGVTLDPVPDQPAAVQLTLVTQAGAPASNATVTLKHSGGDRTVPVSSDGVAEQGGLPAALYALLIERTGSLPIAVYGVALLPGTTDLGRFVLLDGAGGSLTVTPPPPYDGGTSTGGHDAGSADAGTDGGSLADAGITPVAIVTAPATAAPGTMVTLNGMASTGDFPLTYHWSQKAGTTVTLSQNDSATAHSPRFTAPAAGTVVELELVVRDRLGVASVPTTARIGIGVNPIARFTPDSGIVIAGSQSVPLFSTSVDDAGVALVAFDWRLATGSPGTLVADGGPQATLLAPAVSFGAPDLLAGVTLQVTNAIGARSGVATNWYTVRGISPNNWAVDAGISLVVNVGTAPPQVTLSATVSSAIVASPQYTLSWACPGLTLVAPDTLTPRFVAPVVVGANRLIGCTLTATGQAPLDPPMLTAPLSLVLRDTAPPQVAFSTIAAGRMSLFGFAFVANEPISAPSVTFNPGIAYGVVGRQIYNGFAYGSSYGYLSEASSFSNVTADLTDLAPTTNTATNAPVYATPFQVQLAWGGPWVSTAMFTDPRPTVATLSQIPAEVQRAANVAAGTVPGFELVATEGASLVRFDAIDPFSPPACAPSCAWGSTSQALALPDGAPVPGTRNGFGGADLFVAVASDGGLAPTTVTRSAAGAWSLTAAAPGTFGNWDTDLKLVRHDATAQEVRIESYDPATRAFVPMTVAATAVPAVSLLATVDQYVIVVAPGGTVTARRFTQATSSWATLNNPGLALLTQVVSLIADGHGDGQVEIAVESGPQRALSIARVDASRPAPVTSTAVVGYDLASLGGHTYVVYSLNGDIRLKYLPGTFWSGAGGGATDFPGPPRSGFSAPYPTILDENIACEAIYPQFAFVLDALVVVWQERCAPDTVWKVVARAVR